MIKDSTQLIAAARTAVERELQRSIEKAKQPSFYEVYYDGYSAGYNDGATDDIVDLAEEVKTLREQTEWIDINYRMPEENADVLGIVRCGNAEEWTEIYKVSWEMNRGKPQWYCSEAYGHWRVIAWMPIQPIPEKYK